ncbi:hypothetical protein M0R45_015683 [Rubus argutus]|uniref:CSD domain-containing protein n=1 Tax=Rubus argutus TaxID=59490 RepID=A0AAW1XR90_RUBAR
MAEERWTGTEKWFNDTKGFCFITPNDKIDDLFVTNPRSDPTVFTLWRRVRSLSTKTPSAKAKKASRKVVNPLVVVVTCDQVMVVLGSGRQRRDSPYPKAKSKKLPPSFAKKLYD